MERRPGPALSREERATLREIEDALMRDDPQLAELLEQFRPSAGLRPTIKHFVASSFVCLLSGLVALGAIWVAVPAPVPWPVRYGAF